LEKAPLVRSPIYALRLVAGLVLCVVGIGLLVVFENALLGLREDVATIQASWPEWLGNSIEIVIGAGILITIGTTNLSLLVTRRFRRVLLVNAAALLGIALSRLTAGLVTALATSNALVEALQAEGQEASLGNAGLASLVAVFTLVSPWISRRLRPWVVGVVGAGIALSFLGGNLAVISLPLDVGVGLTAGAFVGLVLKTRDRTPSPEEIAAALSDSGIKIDSAEKASVDARGSVPWFVTTTDGTRLFVKTLAADHRSADLLFRLYRWIRLRRTGDRRPFASLERAVEHEALLSLAARARDIRTPQLIVVAEIGTDGMLLAYERIEGRSLDELPREAITPSLLRELWRLVAELDRAGIAHRDLRLANVFAADDGMPWLIDFGFAEMAASHELRSRDVAELISSTAVVVGAEQAIASALEVLGPEHLAEALPWIQPLGLSTATRTQIGKSKGFEKLRGALAEAVGATDVSYVKMERINRRTILVLASLGLAAYVLIPQFAEASGFVGDLLHANLGWTAVACVASALTYLGASVGIIGAVPMPLPLGRVMAAQVASSFANRVTPAKVGGMATNVRFLQRRSIPAPVAISAIGLNTVAGFVIHISLLTAVGVIAGSSSGVDLPLPSGPTAALVVAVLIIASGLLMVLPVGRKLLTRNLLPAMKSAWRSIASVAKAPLKLTALFAGSALVTVSYTVAMIASLQALGGDLPIVTTAVVYLAGAAVATAAPTPGGVGATEAALIAGYTAVGVTGSVAFAAVLLFRFVTFWLPILPGWMALLALQRSGEL
jgi:uncharacterized protein (TIRG00374 family)